MAFGDDCIPNPQSTEIERLEKVIRDLRDAHDSSDREYQKYIARLVIRPVEMFRTSRGELEVERIR